MPKDTTASNAVDVDTVNSGVGDSVPSSLSEILESSLEKVGNGETEKENPVAVKKPIPGSEDEPFSEDDDEVDDDAVAAEEKPEGEVAVAAEETSEGEDEPVTGDDLPPSRLAASAQEKWTDVPVEVKTEVHRAITELTTGIDEYRERLAPYSGLEAYAEQAAQGGTTIQAALGHYTGLEALLNENPVAGIKQICANIGVDPKQAGELLMGQAPSTMDQKDAELVQLRQQNFQLQSRFKQIESERNAEIDREAQRSIQEFSVDKPDFSALSPHMGQLMTSGVATSLQDAYDKARALNPQLAASAVKSKPGKPTTKPMTDRKAQTRKGSLTNAGPPKGTITGKSAGGSASVPSAGDALRNAFERVTNS